MENIPYIQSLHLSILSLLGLNITSHLNRVESPYSTSTITTNTAESRTTTITIPIIGTVLAFVGVVVAIVGVGFAYIQVYRPRNRAAPVDHEALMHLDVEYHSLRDMEAEYIPLDFR